ncbi:uncharacterized protein LOC116346182 [Contarinia nasturtii]|uniref:uncharacterized protein LOC116346182 n=1 Tax=Contarinia nasturtii TaxID=265458 RepID=UPI0012D41F71|nr:uncharacterized protein LOC116346182 [Contarinia nasturtii]
MKGYLTFILLSVTIFAKFDLTNSEPDDPAFTTFLNILNTKVRALLGNKGHRKTNNLSKFFKIDSNLVPNHIRRPRCVEIEGRLADFADNMMSSRRRFTADPNSNSFLIHCQKMSEYFTDIASTILIEPTADAVIWYEGYDDLDYDQLLQNFRVKTINKSYIRRITDRMINDIRHRYNDITSRLIAKMNVASALRREYINLAIPKMQILTHASMQSIIVTLKEPQQRLITALENTVAILNEFNAYRAQLAKSFMQL